MSRRADQSTRIIKQQHATIEHLQAKLSGESFVSHEHYAALQLERDQLAARVAELESELNDWVTGYGSCGCGHPSCRIERDAAVGRGILSRSEPASLALHDAELRRELADTIEQEGFEIVLNVIGWLNYEADRIEQEANK